MEEWEQRLRRYSSLGVTKFWRADVRLALREIDRLRKQIDGHCARIAGQSELLSQRAEKVV